MADKGPLVGVGVSAAAAVLGVEGVLQLWQRLGGVLDPEVEDALAPLAIAGCLGLYFYLPLVAILVLPGWGLVGLLVYFLYSRSRSHVGRGLIEVHEPEIYDIEPPIPGTE